MVVGARDRAQRKVGGETRLATMERLLVNAFWGNAARKDQRRHDGQLTESYGPWAWPPFAVTVPAVVRLWLAMVDRMVADRGGLIVTRDTDGLAILASPTGGKVMLPNGRVVRALSWLEVDDVLRPFDELDPFGTGDAFWEVERGEMDRPLHVLALAPKRYVKTIPSPSGWEIVGGTEHALGGGVADPPGMTGRASRFPDAGGAVDD